MTFPGAGIYGHREGYNTLYGDGHAAWYGDPQQRIIWWSYNTHHYATNGRAWHGMALNNCTDFTTINSSSGTYTRKYEGAVLVWHNIDVAAGQDIAATE